MLVNFIIPEGKQAKGLGTKTMIICLITMIVRWPKKNDLGSDPTFQSLVSDMSTI